MHSGKTDHYPTAGPRGPKGRGKGASLFFTEPLRYLPLIRRGKLREVTQPPHEFVDEQALAMALDMQPKATGDGVAQQGDVMARVIEFYIPEGYEPGTFWEEGEDWGKLLHFPLIRLAKEPWRELVAELRVWAEWR